MASVEATELMPQILEPHKKADVHFLFETIGNCVNLTMSLGFDDKSLIFNANCRNQILLQHIKRKCDCDREDMIELSDENGTVKNLRNYPQEYGVNYLKERETLILLKVGKYELEELNEQMNKITFVPLLSGMDRNQEFLNTLNPKPRARTHRSRSNIEIEDIRSMKVKAKAKTRRKSEVKGLAQRLLMRQK